MTNEIPEVEIEKLTTIKEFVRKYPSFREGGVRSHLRHRQSNGLLAQGAVIEDGRKLLIHESRYGRWLLERSQKRPLNNDFKRAA